MKGKIPRVEFRYSQVYDEKYRKNKELMKFLRKKRDKYPSQKKIIKYKRKIEKIWVKEGRKILLELSKITGLKWKEDIICYVIGRGRPFSDPLTMRIYPNVNDFVDTLTHELIHNLGMQNSDKTKYWWRFVDKKYKNETGLTKSHIFLQAVHWKLLLNFYDKRRLNRNIKRDTVKDYQISWEIVTNEGFQNIIDTFKERCGN